MKNQTSSKATVILQGSYRASDRDRAYRIVKSEQGSLSVETEKDLDAMGEIIWLNNNSFNTQCSVEKTILTELVTRAKL